MINSTKLTIAEIKQKYDSINCHFTYFDGDQYTFDFYGTDASGNEVRISLGGCPAWIKNMSFGPNDPLNITDAIDRHVRYISVTDNRSKIVYEQIFDTN